MDGYKATVIRRTNDLVMAGVAAYRRVGKAMVEMHEMARLRDELAAEIGEKPRKEVRG